MQTPHRNALSQVAIAVMTVTSGAWCQSQIGRSAGQDSSGFGKEPAYCADTLEQFKQPSYPTVQGYRVCHDSAGRIRKERWAYPSADAPKSAATLVSIEILDPVANLIYDLDPRTKKATSRKGFTSPAGFGVPIGGIIGDIPPAPGSPVRPRPVRSEKSLGTKQINGVTADGKLEITVYPAGYRGRAEAATTTVETWHATEINALVRSVRTDPINGDYEFQMQNIEIGEPDSALFRVPDDYALVERK